MKLSEETINMVLDEFSAIVEWDKLTDLQPLDWILRNLDLTFVSNDPTQSILEHKGKME